MRQDYYEADSPTGLAFRMAGYQRDAEYIRSMVLRDFGRAPSVASIKDMQDYRRKQREVPDERSSKYKGQADNGAHFQVRGIVPKQRPAPAPEPAPKPVDLSKVAANAKAKRVRIANERGLIEAVAVSFGITVANIFGPDRNPTFVSARCVAAMLLRDQKNDFGQPAYSYPMIGHLLGGRDHSSIRTYCKTFYGRARKYPDMLTVYNAMRGEG